MSGDGIGRVVRELRDRKLIHIHGHGLVRRHDVAAVVRHGQAHAVASRVGERVGHVAPVGLPPVSEVPFGRYDVSVSVPGATLEVRRISDDRRIRIHVETGVRRLVDHLQEHRGARFESIIVSGGDRHIVRSKGVVVMVRVGVGRIPDVSVSEVPVPIDDRSIGVVSRGIEVRVLTHISRIRGDAHRRDHGRSAEEHVDDRVRAIPGAVLDHQLDGESAPLRVGVDRVGVRRTVGVSERPAIGVRRRPAAHVRGERHNPVVPIRDVRGGDGRDRGGRQGDRAVPGLVLHLRAEVIGRKIRVREGAREVRDRNGARMPIGRAGSPRGGDGQDTRIAHRRSGSGRRSVTGPREEHAAIGGDRDILNVEIGAAGPHGGKGTAADDRPGRVDAIDDASILSDRGVVIVP